jgi:hypothetical protein
LPNDQADLANRDRHVGLNGFLESLQHDLDVVRRGRDIRERVTALPISGRLAGEVVVLVDDRHPRPWNGRPLRVHHRADEAPIQQLSVGAAGCGGKHSQGHTHQKQT